MNDRQAPVRAAIYVWGLQGGAFTNVAIDLANSLRTLQWQVDIVSVRGGAAGSTDRLPPGVAVIDLASRRSATSIAPLRRYIRARRPDLLISLGWLQNPIAVLAAKSTRWRGILVLTEHAHMTYKAREHRRTPKLRLIPIMAKALYPKADAVVAVTQSVLDDLQSIVSLDTSVTRVISNAVDLDRIKVLSVSQPSEVERKESGFQILSVGRLAAQKDQQTLIQAFSLVVRVCPSSLLILGEGPARTRLEVLIRELRLSRLVHLPGAVANPYPAMRDADLFVLSSQEEGFGLVLVEAMALNCPIVSTDCPGGPIEVTEGGKSGMLVPSRRPDLLAEGMIRMLEDPRLRQAYQERGLMRARDFAPPTMAKEWLSLYEVCKARRAQ